MKELHELVNIIPVIAKADTLTPKEVKELKQKVCPCEIVCTCVWVCGCLHIMYICQCVCTYVNLSAQTYARTYVCVCFICLRMFVCVYSEHSIICCNSFSIKYSGLTGYASWLCDIIILIVGDCGR